MKNRKNAELDMTLVNIANRKKPDRRFAAIFRMMREAERKGYGNKVKRPRVEP